MGQACNRLSLGPVSSDQNIMWSRNSQREGSFLLGTGDICHKDKGEFLGQVLLTPITDKKTETQQEVTSCPSQLLTKPKLGLSCLKISGSVSFPASLCLPASILSKGTIPELWLRCEGHNVPPTSRWASPRVLVN